MASELERSTFSTSKTQLCISGQKVATDNTEMNECGYDPKNFIYGT
jgi:hypothetical protein